VCRAKPRSTVSYSGGQPFAGPPDNHGEFSSVQSARTPVVRRVHAAKITEVEDGGSMGSSRSTNIRSYHCETGLTVAFVIFTAAPA